MVTAVLFDAGGTLFHRVPSTTDVVLSVIRKHGHDAPRAAVHEAFHAAIHNEGVPEPGGEAAAWRAVNEDVLTRLAVPLRPEVVADLSHALEHQERAVYPDVVPALTALRARGLRLAVVSNFSHSLPRILDELALTPWFERVVYSWRAGVAKPDARIYREALEALGVAPAQAVMVGDSWLHDVEGPEAIGVRGFFLDRDGRDPRPARVRSLVEFADRVAKP